ncbi:uncharacterized protein LOC110453317 isoform X2 [Mizuhopecten yessoensis]|uniref:uncharacterized protein LOC110453317 isoform X2 n=1 Tax=Mizuhopecten yessoensis TaxID=6573 RepID=UPI000B45D4FB|nr:uncharacterized protein LOC110453317 isoform X2 [Mizuhopecten yessoensis]
MGVDLAVYRSRVGQFVPRPVKGIVSNIDYLCKAIASVRGGLIRQDGLNSKGAVTFIGLLLRAQGIEPNPGPGPGKGDEHSFADAQTEDNDDINITLDSNTDPNMAGRISQFMESVLPVSNPTNTGSSQTDEYAVAVAIPDPFSRAIAKTTIVPQVVVNVNYQDNRKYNEEIRVENMKVKNAENVCTGEQTIIHTAPTGNEDDGVTKPKKKREEEKGVPKSPERNASEGQTADNEDEDIPKQRKKSDKRILLEENTEVMLKRHIEETANLLVARKGAVAAVVKRLKDYNMVVIAGVTGEGKTTLGREICKQLRDGTLDKDIKPKTPVLMTISQDWNDVVTDKDDIVVFVDDIFGKTNYQTGLLNGWKPFFDRILDCLLEKNVCLVITSRTHILKDARRESGVLPEMTSDHILSEKKTVDLTDDQKLTSGERLDIYKNHSRQRQVDKDVLSSVFLPVFAVHGFPSNISLGFAQICKLFFTNDIFFEKGEQFFMKPDRILTEEIVRMKSTEPHKYFALVYCFLNDAAVDVKKLNRLKMSTQDYDTLKLYAEVCGVPQTDNVLTLLKNGLDALDRTYLTKQNTAFAFGHQSTADSVSIVFGKENPELILEKCSNRVILELLDVSETDQTDMCTLHVPTDCFGHLVKRIYKMIIEGNIFDGITLESFPRFRNQELADHLFEYINKSGDMQAFHRAHLGDDFSSAKSLLESCANNVFFLKSLFKFNVDEFIVRESGILFFTRTLQRTLRRSLEHKNRASTSFLLENGAFLTEKYLHMAIGSQDVALAELVLPRNIWTKSEVSEHIDDKTPDHIREMLQKCTNMCKVNMIRNRYLQQKTYVNTKDINLSSMSTKEMKTAAEEMDFDTLHTIFQSPELKDHHYRLIKAILDTKHKRLSDAIAIKKMAGKIDGAVVQYALHHCDLDMFRFLLFSSNVNEAQLTSMLSEAIHLNKTDQIEILIKVGGQPSLDDFIRKAGIVCMGVERVVETIINTTSWTRAQLGRVLDAAVRTGTHATIKVLFKDGTGFAEDALVNVSKREYDRHHKCTDTLTPDQVLLQTIMNYIPYMEEERVPKPVAYVFSKNEWSESQITEAMNAALDSGSFDTVQFLKQKGGHFHSEALLAAVRRPCERLKIVTFVKESREWSVDQLSDALHEAIVICRPDVIIYLNEQGALFNDSSLLNVLRWKVAHHVQIKLMNHIIKARSWSRMLLNEATHFACETNGLSILAILNAVESISEAPTRDVLLKLQEIEQFKKMVVEVFKDNGMGDDLSLVLNKEIREGCTDIVEHLIGELGISCDNDGLSNSMDNNRNYQSYDRLKMVRLVRESQDWSDELLTRALDKAVRLGYSEVILYLHTHGANFGDNSLEYGTMNKNIGYDPYDLVTYIMESRHYNKEQINNALTKSLEVGHYQLMTMFHEKGAEFADKSLQNAIHKKWIPSDRLPAVQFILNARRWDTDEKNDALFSAVKLGDIRVIARLLKCGGEVSKQCLTEILEKKCKPSHRLCIVRLLLSSSGSLSPELLEEAGERVRQLSEPKLEAYIKQCNK